MKNIVISLALILTGFLAGALATTIFYSQVKPTAGDLEVNRLGSILGALYNEQGESKPISQTRDSLALDMANSLVLAATAVRTINDPMSEIRLDRYINIILENDLLVDVKEVDARAQATHVARCWQSRNTVSGNFDECVTKRSPTLDI